MHVLLIEDNDDDAFLIRDTLSRCPGEPVTVEWVDRIERGLAHLAQAPVDAVLVDLSLPDSHGVDTVAKLRRHAHDAPVVVLTGLDDEAVAEQALRHGAQDYLVKARLSGDALMRAIRYAVGRHQVELALRKSEERFQLACRATRDAIWDWDIDADTLTWNDTYQAVFGFGPPERDRKLATWSERIHPDERAGVLADLRAALQSPSTLWTAEFRFRRSDGTYAYALNRGYVVRGQDGVPRRMIGAMIDMSERRQLDRQRAAQLAVTIALDESVSFGEAMPTILRVIGELKDWAFGALWLVDTHQKILRADATWQSATLDAEDLAAVYSTLSVRQGAGLAGRTWKAGNPVILADIAADTTFPTAYVAQQAGLRGACAFPIHRGQDIIGVLEFYTKEVLRPDEEQRQMLAELGAKISQFLHRRDLERQLRQSQKMEALGRMAGGIAHDFNNLLTVINSWSELLLEHAALEDKWQRGLMQIKEAGDKAAGLTRQLLMFTRHQAVEQQIMNLNERVMSIVELMQRVIGEDIQLVVELDPHLGPVRADAGQIEQVIMNLVVNARDAMPQGGRLELTTKTVLIEEADPSCHDELRPGSYAVLTVRDSGCGMDADTLAHIFEPFFTTKERGKGTGLGLATVYGIIKQSAGSIAVSSETGSGTTFTIYLPQLSPTPPDSQASPPAPPPVRGSETVLLVEDDDMVRRLAQVILESHHYRVLPARNADEAIDLAGDHAEEIDVVMTDMVMPGMGGPDLAERLRQLRPGLRVIVTSGYAGRGQELIESLGSQTAFLQKPYTPDMLIRKIREVLDASGASLPINE
ncbi:MAG TPA: response regulator [Nitrospiraceae bacterium]|nr:response regulator [Nitrospiraceae bacterium]